jgi:putative membrane protein
MATTPPTSLPDATRLAIDRTRLAYDRTLMAWIRTAASLISFGFTIYKFFQYLRDSKAPAVSESLIGPRRFALIMISIGVVALALATLEHRRSMNSLRTEYGHVIPFSLTLLVAGLIACLGLLGLVSVYWRM